MRRIIWMLFIIFSVIFIGKTILISHRLYISSIYFDKKEEFELVFFSPSALSVGKSESSGDEKNTVISMNGETLEDVFNKIEMSTDFEINYRHVVSVIFSPNFLKMENLNEFVTFIAESEYIDFNFYIFSTKDSKDDIFSFKNPDSTSTYYSILNVTRDSEYLFNYIAPLNFVRFLRLYSKKEFLLKIPEVTIEEKYTIGDEKTKNLKLSGVAVVKKDMYKTYSVEEDVHLLFLNSFDQAKYYLSEIPITVNEVNVKTKKKDKLYLNIDVSYKALFSFVKSEDVKTYIEDGVKKTLDKLYSDGMDYLRINDINEKYNKQYSINDVNLNINVNHN